MAMLDDLNQVHPSYSFIEPVWRSTIADYRDEQIRFPFWGKDRSLMFVRCFFRKIFVFCEAVNQREAIFAKISPSAHIWVARPMIRSRRFHSIFWKNADILFSIIRCCKDMIHKLDEFYEADFECKKFGAFRIDSSMMFDSIPIIKRRIMEIMEFWDAGIPECIGTPSDPVNEALIDFLFKDLNIYGLYLGYYLCLGDFIDGKIEKAKKQVLNLDWDPIVSYEDGLELCSHHLLPHPDHFIIKKKIACYLDACRFAVSMDDRIVKDDSFRLAAAPKKGAPVVAIECAPPQEMQMQINISLDYRKKIPRKKKYRGLTRRLRSRRFESAKKRRSLRRRPL